jgi:hypothetical protein
MTAQESAAKRRRALKRLYADFAQWLNLKFNEWDPQGIVYEQEDEYSPEVSQIVPLLREPMTVEDLTRRIHAIFVRMFDAEIAGSADAYRPFASEILDEWQKRWEVIHAD